MSSSNNRKLGSTDKILYKSGLVALGIVIAAVLLYFITGISVIKFAYPCLFYRVTGLSCPGCGGTRSLRALLEGDILRSLYLYPPLLFMMAVYVVFMVRCFLKIHFGINKSEDGTVIKYIYIFIGLMLLQWIIKIVAKLIFGYDWYV